MHCKQFLVLFLTFILLAGCGNEGVDVKFRTIYKSSASKNGVIQKSGDLYSNVMPAYTQFGTFVGTLTPGKVTARFSSIRFIDKKKSAQQAGQTMVEIIGTNWRDDDPRRFADFTNGNTIELKPDMYGNIDNDGWFADDTIVLRYLGIFPVNFNFEVDLPAQFSNQPLNLNTKIPNLIVREGNRIKCDIHYFLAPLSHRGFDYDRGIYLKGFVFGEADSTYIVRQENIQPGDIAELITMAQPHSVARSSNYTCPVLTAPASGETKIVTTTIRFDSDNLIQHYAGRDNIPYNFDDIFVFEPLFWDRFHVEITQN